MSPASTVRLRSVALGCAGLALLAALAGCPGGGSGTPEPSTSPQPADSAHLPPPPSPGVPQTGPK